VRKLTALLLLLTFLPSQLFAWGFKGHRVVADIAGNHLSPVAKQRLQVLLGNGDLATISTWADEVRPDRPETAGWHFVDIPRLLPAFQISATATVLTKSTLPQSMITRTASSTGLHSLREF